MSALDEGRMVELWQTYRTELLRFVRKRVREEAVAEDLVHDVLTKAHTRWQDLRNPGKLRPWLYQVTRNALVDHYRSRKPFEPLPEDLISEEGDADKRAEQELARCLLPLLEGLPPAYRHALTLAEFAGLTQGEIASREGLSLSGAKSRVQRARAMLRDVLVQCCRVELDMRGGVVDYEPAAGCAGCGSPAEGLPDPCVEPKR